jgi:hypothetical protein
MAISLMHASMANVAVKNWKQLQRPGVNVAVFKTL